MEKGNTGIVILRWFFGIVFIVAALDKIFHFQAVQEMFGGLFGTGGLVLLIVAIIIELGGGIALLAQYKVRRVSMILFGFMVVALVTTFVVAQADFIGILREMFIMNTGGGNTAVNFAFLAGLASLYFGSE